MYGLMHPIFKNDLYLTVTLQMITIKQLCDRHKQLLMMNLNLVEHSLPECSGLKKKRKFVNVFHISSIVLVPWSSCLGGYLSVPDDYPLVLGCEEHVSSLGIFVA